MEDEEVKLGGGEMVAADEERKARLDVVWLYCLVFPTKVKKKDEAEIEAERNVVLDALNSAKLVTSLFYSSTKQHIFCKVGMTEARLLLEADIQQYKLRLDEKAVKAVLESDADMVKYGRSPVFVDFPYKGDVELPHDYKRRDMQGGWIDMTQKEASAFVKKMTSLRPFQYLHVRYNDAWEHRINSDHGVQIYKRYQDGTILRTADRIKLCRMAMERSTAKDPEHNMPGAGVFPKKMLYKKELVACYPLQLGTSRADAKEQTPMQLFAKWNGTCSVPWEQPLDDIRDYAGEKIALYFAFLGHYTFWLVGPAFIGTAIFVHQMFNLNAETGSFNVVSGAATLALVGDRYEAKIYTEVFEAPLFALFISLWASFLIEFWKRKQARLSLRWGMSDFEETVKNRVEFRPSHIVPSPVTGEPEEYYSSRSFLSKLAVSASVIFTAITVVIAAIGGILVLKVVLSEPGAGELTGPLPAEFAPQLALVVNALTIILLGNVYKTVARKLNDWENHRTDVQYEDFLILKTFIFSFFNSYSTLTYMAFIKSGISLRGVDQFCIAKAQELSRNSTATTAELIEADRCYGSLSYSLFIIFGTQIVVNNLMEVGMPFFMSRFKSFMDVRGHAKKLKKAANKVQKDVKVGLEDAAQATGMTSHQRLEGDDAAAYDDDEEKVDMPIDLEDVQVRRRMKSPLEHQLFLKEYETPFDDYLELALQFGYVTLFVAAFPIAPLLALLNNVLEVRVDSYKVTMLSRRPHLVSAQDIGTWQKIFQFMGFAAVISNASVILYTGDFIEVNAWLRVWLWVAFVSVVMGVKYIVDYLIPDTPAEVNTQLKRQEFVLRKVFLLERDDEELSAEEKKRNSRRYSLQRSIAAVDPFINELCTRAAEAFKRTKGENWDAREIFNSADENNDGELSIKELKKVLLRDQDGLINYLSKYEIVIFVNALDVDGDGVISRSEFRRFLNM